VSNLDAEAGTPMTLTAYATRRGVSVKAVSKAVAAGRLAGSVVRDKHGAPKIGDPELADLEWSAKTRASIDRADHPPSDPAAQPAEIVPRPRPAPIQRAPAAITPRATPSYASPPAAIAAPAPAPGVPDYHESRARKEAAAARREAALADVAELDAAERKGELVPVVDARDEVIAAYTIARTRLLGVPSRLAQRLPHLAGEVVPVLDDLLREALEELSVDEERADGDAE
jgi:hypothetical protein